MSCKPVFYYKSLVRNTKASPEVVGKQLQSMDKQRGFMICSSPFSRRDLLQWFKVPRHQRKVWWREVCQSYRS